MSRKSTKTRPVLRRFPKLSSPEMKQNLAFEAICEKRPRLAAEIQIGYERRENAESQF